MNKRYEVLYDKLQKEAEEIEFRNHSPWQLSYAQSIIEIRKMQVEILKCLDGVEIKVDRTPLIDPKVLHDNMCKKEWNTNTKIRLD